jgi:uncharacterized protein
MFASSSLQSNLPTLFKALYAASLEFAFAGLSVRTLRLRCKIRIRFGNAGHPEMLRAARVHANVAEYVPLCLGLMGLAELRAAPYWFIQVLGIVLVMARLGQAYGITLAQEKLAFRVIGATLNVSTLLTASSCLIFVTLR